MNNLHRELAPISEAAWAEIEEEATRSFKRNIAGRRLVDVKGPMGQDTAAVTLGHRSKIDSPADGIQAFIRRTQSLVELKVPFTVSREAIDDVDRGAQDSDWDPVVEAARQLALAEDRAIFEGYAAASISGIRAEATATPIQLPEDVRDYPEAVSQALTTLRLASVDGPYSVAMSAEVYTQVNETSNHGYPIRQHIQRLLDGDIVWAPAIRGAFVMSTRGGDFELTIGQDVSIGYDSHDADVVNLYFQESFTYLTHTGEAAVALFGG
ncbi:family 1 encapsulin nanocompartment shell protein [Gordonia alkanivorans]|uniref:Type 1 encapsulin shell protein n=2 Tax=Gordonia rubripertincta TaxID=36822 RepID=A0AAW4FZW1_GORRU|nr:MULTISPECIES: family 1 encapsulin nanocompartment shell protein [Gordonia]ASR05310.1 Linocin-M18 [Gordonia rubripertincta]MBM7276373.1 bacteriocin family protein [Gordonia rubripertincta]MDG6782187.1 family 1 encapsulin nanocompartment shell protein [Gordonia rubripertincta]MDH3024715.1 family 1 encapsulin nanocompartment shell protein [Gordonia alkanivorans]NKY65075.1 bacteriocin family protein [Gordonia rubripertincta]